MAKARQPSGASAAAMLSDYWRAPKAGQARDEAKKQAAAEASGRASPQLPQMDITHTFVGGKQPGEK